VVLILLKEGFLMMKGSVLLTERETKSSGVWLVQSVEMLQHAMKVVELVFERNVMKKRIVG